MRLSTEKRGNVFGNETETQENNKERDTKNKKQRKDKLIKKLE